MATAGEQATASGEDVAGVGGIGSDTLAETLLDDLPPELLLHIFSWLDGRSLVRLERVSVRCQEAVALHLGRLRLFSVDYFLWREFYGGYGPGVPLPLPLACLVESQALEAASALTALLSKMVTLRELHVHIPGYREYPQHLLTAVVTASRYWSMLERLKLNWWDPSYTPDPGLLHQLNANCDRLTSLTLVGEFTDNLVTAVVTSLSALRTLCVSSAPLSGSFLSHLPTDLQNLSLGCQNLRSWPLTSLLRCRELRSLEFWGGLESEEEEEPEPTQLVSVLVGCAHLERLYLHVLREEFVACLPPDGLPTLRHLNVRFCLLNDAAFGRLVERLPGLESVSREYTFL